MSAVYLLDANAITHAIRQPTGAVATRIDRTRARIVTSVIVESEIRYGIARNPTSKVGARAARYLDSFEVLPLDSASTEHYGQIRAHLEAVGEPIGAMDLLIAAHARSVNATLVTDDTSDFARVPDLAIVNWQQS